MRSQISCVYVTKHVCDFFQVFIGESLSAKVSYFEVKVNKDPEPTRVKSSGVLVCTGTGSTSWYLSMNRCSQEDVQYLLHFFSQHSGTSIDPTIIPKVCDEFNNRFIFSPGNQFCI